MVDTPAPAPASHALRPEGGGLHCSAEGAGLVPGGAGVGFSRRARGEGGRARPKDVGPSRGALARGPRRHGRRAAGAELGGGERGGRGASPREGRGKVGRARPEAERGPRKHHTPDVRPLSGSLSWSGEGQGPSPLSTELTTWNCRQNPPTGRCKKPTTSLVSLPRPGQMTKPDDPPRSTGDLFPIPTLGR